MKKAIAIMGGGLKKDKHNKWQTTNFKEGDEYGALGDRLRVVAASYLYKEDEEQTVIALGGRGQLKKIVNSPTVAHIIKQELIELKVPAKKIIKQELSDNSYQQLQDLQKIIIARGFTDVIIISNKYHLPRIKAMIENCSVFKKMHATLNDNKLKFKSAENIIIKYEPESKKQIEKAYQSKEMKDRVLLELKGVEQIKKGIYKFK